MTTPLVRALVGPIAALALIACSEDSTDPQAAASGDGAGGGGAAAGAGGGDAGGGVGGVGGGGACDDSGPDPNNHTAGTCENLGETSLVAYCNEAIEKLDPGVAYAAISCIAVACLRVSCDIDEYQQAAEQCLLDALAGAACPDDDADATCAQLEPLCNATAPECHALLDGMTEATRAAVLACAQVDCGAGLEGCAAEALAPD